MLAGEVLERLGMDAGGQDLERLDDPRPRAVEVGVSVGEVRPRAPSRGEGIAQSWQLRAGARQIEAAGLDQDDVRFQRGQSVQ